MIENALEIKGTHPKEVMTTLVNVVTVDSGALLVDFNHLFADSCENLDCFMKFYKDTKVFFCINFSNVQRMMMTRMFISN